MAPKNQSLPPKALPNSKPMTAPTMMVHMTVFLDKFELRLSVAIKRAILPARRNRRLTWRNPAPCQQMVHCNKIVDNEPNKARMNSCCSAAI
jgi:hypothetical protein